MGIADKALIAACGFNVGVFLYLSVYSKFKSKEHVISLILAIIAVGFCIWG